MVPEMPLGEAHVHQLPVQVIEGRLGGTQPGTCLLLTGSRAPWRSTMTSVEKALEDEDRQMNPEEVLLELKLQPGDSMGPALPLGHSTTVLPS